MTDLAVDRLKEALKDRYLIQRELGVGGMATVYLADDIRHQRKVAVKVLKPELAAVMGGERFLSEIRTTANLQHPHILQLYDSGEADGFLYFVMPFVEGETLRDRIDREKQLPVDEAVELARAVATALKAAHEQGVIHRDIKPANILLSHGQPLVADFGIALAVQEAGGGRLTETGLSLGTPYYMSPEQATGDRDPDARADIYSLGSVLYEMLCGEPPFTGSTAQAVLGKILTAAPTDPTQFRQAIPRHVEAVILKALERVPADRFATAGAFADALGNEAFRHRDPVDDADSGKTGGAAVQDLQRRVRAWAGATVVLAAGLVWALLSGGAGSTDSAGVVELYVAGDTTHRIMTGFPGSVALSSDGRTLAYIGEFEGNSQVYLRRLDERDARVVPGTDGANGVFFSHDDDWLGFGTRNYGVYKVRVAGGSPVAITQLENTLMNGYWAADGFIYYGVTGLPGLLRVSEDGGAKEELLPQSDSLTGVMDPWLLPGGDVVLATGLMQGTQLIAYDLRDGTVTVLGPGLAPRFVDGYLVYGTEDGVVLAHPFDARSLEFTGDPVRIADGVGGWLNISRDMAISSSGAFAYVTGDMGLNELIFSQWSPPDAHVVATDQALRTPRISPDGEQILYGTGTSASIDLYLASRSQGTKRLLATALGGLGASWSPDGSKVVYAGGVTEPSIWELDLTGGGEPELIFEADFHWVTTLPRYSWNGEHLILERGPVPRDIVSLALDGSDEVTEIVRGAGDETQNAPSPTGPWLAYTSDETGRSEVYVVPFEGGARLPISTGGGLSPTWSATGDTLFYWPLGPGQALMSAALSFDGEARVVSRSTVPLNAPLLELVTMPAQYDMHPIGVAQVATTAGGDRIVIRTHFMPSGN